jgi:hypothetical protein
MDNVKHQVARFELARAKLAGIGVERKTAKRVNLGGISLGRSDGVNNMLHGTTAAFASELLNFSNTKGWVIVGLGPESYPSCGFIDQIWELMELTPLDARLSRVQTSTQGCSIGEPIPYLSRHH